MIEFMQREDEPDLQVRNFTGGRFLRLNGKMEAAWVLTNIVSGTTSQTQIVINKGAIPWFIKILGSKNMNLREQV